MGVALPASGFWNGDTLPLSRWSKFASTQIDDVHAHMSRIFCPHRLDTEGGAPPLAFRHHQATLKSLTFNAIDYGNPYGRIAISIPPISDLCLVQFSLSGAARITQNNETFELRAGQLCVLDPDAQLREVFDQDYKHFTVKIPRADLEAVLAQEVGFRPGRLLFKPGPVDLKGPAAAFAHLVRTICDDIDAGISTYTHARTCGVVEDMLKRLLLTAVPHNHSDLFNAPPSGPSPYYVRRVEEYVREHASDPISLADMIAVSGVSPRSLHAGFRRFRNTTPMGYVKNYRLDRAHAMLKSGIDQGQTVTDIALACGLTHLSKFARDYYERFGERPSDTLKQFRRG